MIIDSMSLWGGTEENMRKSVILAVCYGIFAAAVVVWAALEREAYLLLLAAYAGIMSLIVYKTGDRTETGKKSPKMSDGDY